MQETQEMRVRFLGWEDSLEKETATHSSILAWRIPRTEEPGRLYSPWGCKELDTTEPLPTHTLSTCFTWESTSPTPPSALFHGNSSLYFVDFIFLTLEYVGIPPIAICSYGSRFPRKRARYSSSLDEREAILT